eukprot:SAG31_NODE_3933_length_3738_cov_6.025282_2_plen_175_part_00
MPIQSQIFPMVCAFQAITALPELKLLCRAWLVLIQQYMDMSTSVTLVLISLVRDMIEAETKTKTETETGTGTDTKTDTGAETDTKTDTESTTVTLTLFSLTYVTMFATRTRDPSDNIRNQHKIGRTTRSFHDGRPESSTLLFGFQLSHLIAKVGGVCSEGYAIIESCTQLHPGD